jgi:hypothetical protein
MIKNPGNRTERNSPRIELPTKMTGSSQLLIFTRYPEAGRTKTRLIPALGAEGAACLHRRLTEKLIGEAGQLERQLNTSTVIHFTGGSKDMMTAWLGPLACVEQAGGDLGLRMRTAFCRAFAGGADRAVLVGTDIPDLDAEILARAFAGLQTGDAVIGPSRDGGYYLIGLTAGAAPRLFDPLFHEMVWSTGEVFASTVSRLEKCGCRVTILPTLADIDRPEDLIS